MSSNTVADLIKFLQTSYKPSDYIAHHLWSIADVQGMIKNDIDPKQLHGVTLNEQDFVEILTSFGDHCDSENGLTWNGLSSEIIEYAKDKSLEETRDEVQE